MYPLGLSSTAPNMEQPVVVFCVGLCLMQTQVSGVRDEKYIYQERPRSLGMEGAVGGAES